MNDRWLTAVRWLVVLAMPFFLGFSAIRLFINGAELFVSYEYGKELFPEDLAIFSESERERLGLQRLDQQQRESLALVAVDYLQRDEPAEEVIHMLEEQRLPGTNEPLYKPSEISHMVDVKRVTDSIGRLNLLAGAIVLAGLFLLLRRPQTRRSGYRAILQGGVFTTVLLLFIGLFIVLAWNLFFVQFHELLFPPGTWTFAHSDSLIRLFPEKFWFDFGVLLSLTALLFGVLATGIGYYLQRRSIRQSI